MPINNYGALKRHFVRNTQNNSNVFPKFILIDGINNRLNDNKRSVKGQKKKPNTKHRLKCSSNIQEVRKCRQITRRYVPKDRERERARESQKTRPICTYDNLLAFFSSR